MVRQFGENIRPYLDDLWQRANKYLTEASAEGISGRALNDISSMIPWRDNEKGQVRSLPRAKEIFSQYITAIDPTFDATLLNHVSFRKVKHGKLTDGQGLHAGAQYGPFFRGTGPHGEFIWGDILGPDRHIVIPTDRKVFGSDEAIVGIIAHELHELRAIRTKIESSPNRSISALERVINFRKCCTKGERAAISLGWHTRQAVPRRVIQPMSVMKSGIFAVIVWS